MTTAINTGVVRLSYANLFEARGINGNDPKYSTAILIPKSDVKTVQKIKEAIAAAAEQGKAKWGGKVPGNLKTPLRDGDEERPDDENYANHYFLNATSKNKPSVAKPVGRDANGKPKFQEITDTTEVYSGCYAKVNVNFYPFNTNGNRGIAAGLNIVVKVQDGEPLAGRASVSSAFADEDFDDMGDDDFLG